MLGQPPEGLDAALAEAESLLALDGVEGVGQGATEDGEPSIVVLSTGLLDTAGLPDTIGGFPVSVLDIGEPPSALDHDAVDGVELSPGIEPDGD